MDSGVTFARVPPSEIYRFARETWDERADGLFHQLHGILTPCLASGLGKGFAETCSDLSLPQPCGSVRLIHVKESPGFGRLLTEYL